MSLEAFSQRGVVLKTEAVEGVDSLPTALADGLLLLNGSSKLSSKPVERVIDRPYFGSNPFVLTQYSGSIDGDIELIGAAAPGTASRLSTALKIAGLAETLDAVGPPAQARYNPITAGIPSATAYFYHAGTLIKLTSCRAAISGVSLKIGGFPTAKISIQGNSDGLNTEVALPAIDISGTQSPVPISTETMTLSIAGFAVEGIELNMDFGTEIGITEHSEARIARIGGRAAKWDSTFFRPALASLDPRLLMKSHTLIPIVGLVDGGVGKITRITIGFGQIETVEDVEIDKFRAYKISGRCIPSVGNDEFLIEFE